MEQEKKVKIYDLLIVLGVAILPILIRSIHAFVSGVGSYSQRETDVSLFYSILEETLAILLLLYVLFNRNKTYKDLGIVIHWKDILLGVGVFISAMILYACVYYILILILPPEAEQNIVAKNVDDITQSFSLYLIIFVIINPFFEELIVRGFTMVQLFSLTKNKALTVVVSTIIQSSYHIYQGVLPMLSMSVIFLFFSIFYMRTGKLTPILVAHLIFDLLILTKVG